MVSIMHISLNHCSNLRDNFVNWRCLLLLIKRTSLLEEKNNQQNYSKLFQNCRQLWNVVVGEKVQLSKSSLVIRFWSQLPKTHCLFTSELEKPFK